MVEGERGRVNDIPAHPGGRLAIFGIPADMQVLSFSIGDNLKFLT